MEVRHGEGVANKIHGAKHRPWITALLTRRPTKVTAIALANKIRQNGMGDRGEPRVCSMVPVPTRRMRILGGAFANGPKPPWSAGRL